MGSTQAIKQATKPGVGVSVISIRAVEEECRSGLVSCLRLRDLKVTRAFHIAPTGTAPAHRGRGFPLLRESESA